jgi:hypothetical protein
MPVLVYDNGETPLDAQKHHGARVLHVGTAPDADLRIPSLPGAAPIDALIVQSQVYKVYVLVDSSGGGSARVNGRPVVRLKALRHRDRIDLGHFHLTYWELIVRKVAHGSKLAGNVCQVCFDAIAVGEEAVRCPWCDSPHHRACWFYLQNCSLEACGYPVQQTMCQILSPPARFEEVAETSPIVREKKTCPAGERRDMAPFRPGDHVAYCPTCETLFHTECWLALSRCPKCSYDIAALIDRVFKPARGTGGRA